MNLLASVNEEGGKPRWEGGWVELGAAVYNATTLTDLRPPHPPYLQNRAFKREPRTCVQRNNVDYLAAFNSAFAALSCFLISTISVDAASYSSLLSAHQRSRFHPIDVVVQSD